jgi:streptogramin lyase
MVLIQLLLPMTGPDGRSSATAIAETRRELVDRFSGVTAYLRSPAKGLWTGPDGHTEADDVVMVEVVTENFDRTWWRDYATTLARRFDQDNVHVRALPVDMPNEGTNVESPSYATPDLP